MASIFLKSCYDGDINGVKDTSQVDVMVYYKGLERACDGGKFDIVKYLIEGKNLRAMKLDVTCNALFLAAKNGHIDIVKYMHEKGVPLHEGFGYACESGNIELIKYFVDNNEFDSYEFLVACEKNNIELVEFFLDNCDEEMSFNDAFKIACENGCIEIVKYLVGKVGYYITNEEITEYDYEQPSNNESPNDDDDGKIDLNVGFLATCNYACKPRHVEIFDYLTELIGDDCVTRLNNGLVAASYNIQGDNECQYQIMKTLISRGAKNLNSCLRIICNINLKANCGDGLDTAIIQLLLNSGADKSIIDENKSIDESDDSDNYD